MSQGVCSDLGDRHWAGQKKKRAAGRLQELFHVLYGLWTLICGRLHTLGIPNLSMLRAGGYPESVHYQDNFPQPSLILTAWCSERASAHSFCLLSSSPVIVPQRRSPSRPLLGRSVCRLVVPSPSPMSPSRFLIPWSRRQRRSVMLMRRDTPSPGGPAHPHLLPSLPLSLLVA